MSYLSNSASINDKPDSLNSQSSDEKMDTGTDTFLSSVNTPNSTLSSDFDDKDSLKSNTESNKAPKVLRLSEPIHFDEPSVENHNLTSLVTDMSHLTVNSTSKRPSHLGISPPKSMLTSTTDHPLMGIVSPESTDNYPDLIPDRNKRSKIETEPKDLSLSSTEENVVADSASILEFYEGPQRNTSKNNLYFSENFSLEPSEYPDVARVHMEIKEECGSRRRIVAKFQERDMAKVKIDPGPMRVLGRVVDGRGDESAILKYVEERNKRDKSPCNTELEDEMRFNAAKLCEVSPHRSKPTFDLPIQMSTPVTSNHTLESPDANSSSQEDRSAFKALLDPYNGCVALKQTTPRPSEPSPRRRIVALVDDDCCSLDSASLSSLELELELEIDPPEVGCEKTEQVAPLSQQDNSDDDSKIASEYSDTIPEYSAAEERHEARAWLKVSLPTGGHRSCDMKVIEPFKRVLSHGGYDAAGCAIIVFSACYLPDTSRPDYNYVMDNLFLYVIWTLERLVTEEYALIYLHGCAAKRCMPTFHWLHECYKLIDRRLRKSLKHLYLVHPTFWIKSVVLLSKPFVSSKFSRKISYVRNLNELFERVPVEPNAIPAPVRHYDAARR